MKQNLILFFFLLPWFLFAQDNIYRVDNQKIQAKVLEVNPQGVKYILHGSPDSTVQFLNKEYIVLIVYSNGSYDLFSRKKIKRAKKADWDSLYTSFNKNISSVNMFEILLGNFSLCYERILWNGKIGLRPSFTFGVFEKNITSNYHKWWATGFDFNYYPNGQGRIRYFIGPSVETGQYNFRYYWNYQATKRHYNYITLNINNGFLFQITPSLNTSVSTGIGARATKIQNRSEEVIEPMIKIGYNISYRF